MDILTEEQLRQHVISELSTIEHKVKGDEITILCPFHNDHSPSLNIHIGFEITPGGFHCWSCHASGGWNKLARQLNLTSFNYQSSSYSETYSKLDPFQTMFTALSAKPLLNIETKYEKTGLEPLPADFNWRGFGRSFYENLGGQFWWQKDSRSEFEMSWIYFPLFMNREYRGYTVCALKPNKPKYMTFAETEKVLFMYDRLPQNDVIVLVEGHFDSMRLISEGINATAIFGTSNWSTVKREAIIAKLPKKVIVAMDGDESGQRAANEIYNDLRGKVNVEMFTIPDPKLDPGNMPEEMVEFLRTRVSTQ